VNEDLAEKHGNLLRQTGALRRRQRVRVGDGFLESMGLITRLQEEMSE
jgi:hypothetical protein